ncbi:tripartite tricarboxylate transporter TctB family protein [Xinfangfangia pollutisoli]|uniref:tripartite tricarboxylate transporter TctB family protein n=1 Tax=Xinfangfangia pollutisoli TaxID=2865960 RepID=UPI001CD6F6F7|nr:tripartite tricarboxylate transporter TctB family protein [Xinfangfangia pollutisoli]
MTETPLRMNSDIAAGLLFAALGAGFCGQALFGLRLGTPFRMGPGYFPAVIGGLLCLLGLAIALAGTRVARPESSPPLPWKAIVLIPTGLLLFGLVMRPLGLIAALFLLSLLAGFATGQMRASRIVLLAIVMTAACVAIFSFGLGIGLPLIGDLLR